MPIVLVELPAADAAHINAPALIAACSSGLRRGTCAIEETPNGERATAVAIVVWLDHLRARIDVGRRRAMARCLRRSRLVADSLIS
jgi:hypothetical protein